MRVSWVRGRATRRVHTRKAGLAVRIATPARPRPLHGVRGPGRADASVIRLVDEMIQLYVSWREACAWVTVSYQNWACAAAADRSLAFSAYVAAVDREERAAASYQHVVEQLALI